MIYEKLLIVQYPIRKKTWEFLESLHRSLFVEEIAEAYTGLYCESSNIFDYKDDQDVFLVLSELTLMKETKVSL